MCLFRILVTLYARALDFFGHKTFYFSFCPYLFAFIAVVAVAPIVAAGIVIYCVKSAPIPKAKPRVLYRGIFLVFFVFVFLAHENKKK